MLSRSWSLLLTAQRQSSQSCPLPSLPVPHYTIWIPTVSCVPLLLGTGQKAKPGMFFCPNIVRMTVFASSPKQISALENLRPLKFIRALQLQQQCSALLAKQPAGGLSLPEQAPRIVKDREKTLRALTNLLPLAQGNPGSREGLWGVV